MTASPTALPPIAILRASIAADGAALSLAALAWPASERAGQRQAVERLVAAGEGHQFVLLAARRGEQLCGAALSQVLPGRCAVVWLPQRTATEDVATAAALLSRLCDELAAADVHLAQALLEDAAGPGATLLSSGGFQHAGKLTYMAALAEHFPATPPPLPIGLEPWSPTDSDRLLRIIEATYVGSLDCPAVDRLRQTADVLAGYRAVGEVRPELWLLAVESACLLLADHPQQEQLEIVYLGVVPQCRGRGWGLLLTRHAQWLARKLGRSRVVLAVDAANCPAILSYRAAGFVAWDERAVFVRSLRNNATPL